MAEVQEPFNYDSPRKRWTLTKEAFDLLLAKLDTDNERASEKYLLIRRNLVRFFEGRGCVLAEDHADEAINRLAKKLDEGEEVREINSYIYGIARLLMLEIYKEREREERALKEMPPLRLVEDNKAETDESDIRLECLNQCLEKLSDDSRHLILKYYEGDNQSRIENRKRLTQELGIPNQALRSRAVRIREKLEACLSLCLKKSGSATQTQHFGHSNIKG